MNRDLAWPIGFGILSGVLTSIWSVYQAQAAMKVRPRLNNVDFITALLTQHGMDWLFYYHPIPSAIGWTLFLTTVFAIVWRLV